MNRKKLKNVFTGLLVGDDYLTNHKWLFEITGGFFFLYIFENGLLNVYFSAEMLLQLVL